MAKFVVNHAVADWAPSASVEVDLQVADSLEAELPKADVVLMNPPFIAWAALSPHQREQMRQTLGSRLQGRGDLSMAFVTRALDLLTEGGALGVLLPASLLTLQAAEEWRADLLGRGDLRLLASLGDYGLFAHALVQIAALVIRKPEENGSKRGTTTALVSVNSADATGNALRTLRKTAAKKEASSPEGAWRIFQVETASIGARPTWRLTSPKTETALARLVEAGAVRMAELFEVRQGVRSGDNKAFLLDETAFRSLPVREQRYFRRAIMNDSIQEGRVRDLYWIFYPYGDPSIAIPNEDTLRKAVPNYLTRYLNPRREVLAITDCP